MIASQASLLALSSLAFGLLAAAPAPAAEGGPPAECEIRGGLPNALARLRGGEEVRIAYLGGSITAQPGGWRDKSLDWLRGRYPRARLSGIDATVPGTGSDLGVFRFRRDALRFGPDLVFVEFAVNDDRTDPALVERCMEGIVRQAWEADPRADLCFVYTISEPILADLRAGRPTGSIAAMERVAARYGIPSIDFGPHVARRVEEGRVVFKAPAPPRPPGVPAPIVFSADGTHPLPAGHAIYLRIFARSWTKIAAAAAPPGPHRLGPPLRADNLEDARLLPIGRDMLTGPWRAVSLRTSALGRRFAPRLDGLWQALAPGAALEFGFTGSYAAVYDLMGPDSGEIEVRVDGGPPRILPRFDGYCVAPRLAVVKLLAGAAAGRHRVRIALSPKTPDKRAVLFEANRADFDAHPAKYAGDFWYAGALMIAGAPPLPPGR